MQKHIPVLLYHIVDDNNNSKISITRNNFDDHLRILSNSGYETVNINQYIAFYKNQKSRHHKLKKILITFDDGYEDFYYSAFPLLKKYNMNAINFILTSCVGELNWWNPKASYFKRHLSWDQINELQNEGIEFGAHTTSHQNMAKLSTNWIVNDIQMNIRDLSAYLKDRIRAFSFPYGDFNQKVVNIILQYFDVAFSVEQGCWNPCESMFTINRFSINEKVSANKLLGKVEDFSINGKRDNCFGQP